MQTDPNRGAVTSQSFINRVVDDFPNKVMQATLAGAANVHARTHPDRFEAFEDLNGGLVVV